jgi:photosystem II stability/assembly factor-like uncharacterized protein
VQTPYTGYYNHWRRYIQPFVQEDGTLLIPDNQSRQDEMLRNRNFRKNATTSPWAFVGPEINYRRRNVSADPVVPISWQANVYCIDRGISNPDVLYAGTENGGIYKSIDHGLHWRYLSLDYNQVTVTAIAVNPSDADEVLVCADSRIYRSTDGGASWTQIVTGSFQNRQVQLWQIMYNPAHPSMVFAGADDSLYRSLDGGLHWTGVFGGACHSVAINPKNTAVIYALRHDGNSGIAYFEKSIDSGLTFIQKPNGWFSVPAVDAGLIESLGGRIAVTEADTSRIYVLLVGSSQSTAQLQLNGQIGVYRSNDGGESWTLPHGLIGTPYNATTHPNMMTFDGGNNTYNQIYYNTTLIASQVNADRILIGGMSMWRSNDGAATFGPVGGYLGSVRYIHPDNQEFKVYKTGTNTEEVWVASDGGINFSSNFMFAHESRTTGIYGAAFWGFDQGWNDDIMVGGRYHNGNAARRDGYPAGEYLQLGGGEAATGYVNYSNEKKTYFSDIDGVVLPDTIDGYATSFGMDTDPNESYVDNASSRIMFDWDYWNVAYTAKDNSMLKSTTGASTFSTLYTFGTSTANPVYWIEQSRINTNILYAQQVVNNRSVLWRSVDRGASWTQVALPQSKRQLLFSLSGTNADELWIAYPDGVNGNKIYKSVNSGATWSNLTTAVLNGLQIKSIAHQFGTWGGVYAATFHGPVFYRNDTLPDWQAIGTGLPVSSYPLRVVPFYRDAKLRLATWQLGVWENELFEPSRLMADFSADFKDFYCPGDTLHFVPHAVAGSGATYQWSFPGALPSASTDKYPAVVYQSTGSFDVQLIVSENGASDTIVKYDFIETIPSAGGLIAEGFESGLFNSNWKLKGMGLTSSNWTITNTAGGYGSSIRSMAYDNFNIDIAGAHDQVWTSKCDLTSLTGAQLKFDVAYSDYGSPYSDTLEVLASSDCGQTFTSVYKKGGPALATAPSLTSSIFVPTAIDWRTDSVDVSAFAGTTDVLFSFVDIGHFGQALYVDNIQLQPVVNTSMQETSLSSSGVFPNPFKDHFTLECASCKEYAFTLYDAMGHQVLMRKASGSSYFSVESLGPGYYTYQLSGPDGAIRHGSIICAE